MNSQTLIAILALGSLLMACVPLEDGDPDPEETDAFRAGLISADDIAMDYEPASNTTARALMNGDTEYSRLAISTGHAVAGTNHFLLEWVELMEEVAAYPPSAAGDDYRMWQGPDGDVFYRITVERTTEADGTRFDFSLEGRHVDEDDDELTTLFDGYGVRPDDASPGDRRGWGIIRHDFDAIDELHPEEEIGGQSAVAFRKYGGVHQVEVRLTEVTGPDHDGFVPGAAYGYVQFDDGSGTLDWLGYDDFEDQGQPYEQVSARVEWDADKSGVGNAVITDGSLEVDYLEVGECWNPIIQRIYGRIASPDGEFTSGDAQDCSIAEPADLTVPDDGALDEDEPAVPDEHPAEES